MKQQEYAVGPMGLKNDVKCLSDVGPMGCGTNGPWEHRHAPLNRWVHPLGGAGGLWVQNFVCVEVVTKILLANIIIRPTQSQIETCFGPRVKSFKVLISCARIIAND